MKGGAGRGREREREREREAVPPASTQEIQQTDKEPLKQLFFFLNGGCFCKWWFCKDAFNIRRNVGLVHTPTDILQNIATVFRPLVHMQISLKRPFKCWFYCVPVLQRCRHFFLRTAIVVLCNEHKPETTTVVDYQFVSIWLAPI